LKEGIKRFACDPLFVESRLQKSDGELCQISAFYHRFLSETALRGRLRSSFQVEGDFYIVADDGPTGFQQSAPHETKSLRLIFVEALMPARLLP